MSARAESGALNDVVTTVGPYRIDPSSMAVAHSLIWSISELHTVAKLVGEDGVGKVMATGPWVASIVAGLYLASEGPAELLRHGLVLGDLTGMEIGYSAPVYGGDRISARCRVRGTEQGQDGALLLAIEDSCSNAEGVSVLKCLRRYHYTEVDR